MSYSSLLVSLGCMVVAILSSEAICVTALPFITGPKTMDFYGVKLENLSYAYCGPPDPSFRFTVQQERVAPAVIRMTLRMIPSVDIFIFAIEGTLYLDGMLIMSGPIPSYPVITLTGINELPVFANDTFTLNNYRLVFGKMLLPKGKYVAYVKATNQDDVEVICARLGWDVLS